MDQYLDDLINEKPKQEKIDTGPKQAKAVIKDPSRQYQCIETSMGFRCQNVQWRNKARHPLKTLCNPCSDNRYGNNPLYKQPRRYLKKEIGWPITEE